MRLNGGIRDHPVVGEQPPAVVDEAWLGDDIAALVARRAQAVQKEVQFADGERAEVALLPVQHEVAGVASLLGDVLRRVDHHAGGASSRIADAHPLIGLEQLDDQAYDRTRRIELAAFFACVVGEPVDQVFVGVAEDVPRTLLTVLRQVRLAQVEAAEVPEQAVDDAVAARGATELGIVVPVRVTQHPVEPGRVRLLDLGARPVDHLTKVHRLAHDGAPARLGRHEELMLVGLALRHVARHAGGDRALDLLGEAVGEPPEEEHREDIVLIVARVDLPAQDISGAPEFRLEFRGCERHR